MVTELTTMAMFGIQAASYFKFLLLLRITWPFWYYHALSHSRIVLSYSFHNSKPLCFPSIFLWASMRKVLPLFYISLVELEFITNSLGIVIHSKGCFTINMFLSMKNRLEIWAIFNARILLLRVSDSSYS